jgi:hypothetical protein
MFAKGFLLLLFCSALYEPLRSSLYNLGNAVGGVGGVGGLTNQWDPRLCDSKAGKMGEYCFHKGVFMGFTPFAIAVIIAWALPLASVAAITSLSAAQVNKSTTARNGEHQLLDEIPPARDVIETGEDHREASDTAFGNFLFLWTALNGLWYFVPAAAYLTSEFYQENFYHIVLGSLGIPAAYPLSWHLALVAVPMSDFIAPLLGWSRQSVARCHKVVGRWTVLWAAAHGTGQIVYLLGVSGTEFGFPAVLDISNNGGHLIYLFGLATLCIVIIHLIIVSIRHTSFMTGRFHLLHRIGAVCLLLCATAHWWPFAFFLIPAVAVHATGFAAKLRGVKMPVALADAKRCSLALAVATASEILGTAVVWLVRQAVMSRPQADLYTPYIFPPLALFAGFLFAFLAAYSVLACLARPLANAVA